MANSPILIHEKRYHQIKAVLARLRLDASARLVVLVDKDGQQIAVHGELGELPFGLHTRALRGDGQLHFLALQIAHLPLVLLGASLGFLGLPFNLWLDLLNLD